MPLKKIHWYFFILSLFAGIHTKALTADFTASATIGCVPMVVTFTNISSGATSYDWDFGDGTGHKTITSPTHTFSAVGTYTVKLTAYGSSGSSATKTMTIYVYDVPTIYFKAADTSICVCNSAVFTDSSVLNAPGTGSYYWQFGTGDVSSSKNPTYSGYCSSYTPGYTVILKVTNSAGCFSSLSKPNYIHVYSPSSASFTASPTSICGLSGSVSFTSSASGGPGPYSYDWDFGDGSAHGTSANPTHSYSSSTYRSYTVTLVVTSHAGCKDTVVMTDYINLTHITASFTTAPANDTLCANEYLIVHNTTTPAFTGTTYYWGDHTSSTTDPTYHGYAAGTYTLKMVAQNGPCLDSTTKNIVVRPVPTINFVASPLDPCPAPFNIHFIDSSSGVSSYLWNFGDSTSSTLASPYHTYYDTFSNGSTSYSVKLIGSNRFGCVDSLTRSYYINLYDLNLKAFANGTPDSIGGCIPVKVDFSMAAYYAVGHAYPYGLASILWDFGDGDSSTASFPPTHTYNTFGRYVVKLFVTTNNGCKISDTLVILVGTPVSAGFHPAVNNQCADQDIQFINTSDSATVYTWIWDAHSTTYSYDTTAQMHSFHLPGPHTLILIATYNGCPDTFVCIDCIWIHVASADFQYKYNCVPNNALTFYDESVGADTHKWNFGDGSAISTLKYPPAHNFPDTGKYTVSLVVSSDSTGCVDSVVHVVTVHKPYLGLTAADTVLCNNNPDWLTASVTGISYFNGFTWYVDSTRIWDTTTTITDTFKTRGFHTVRYIISDERWSDTPTIIFPPPRCLDTLTRNNYIGVAQPLINFIASPLGGCLSFTPLIIDSSKDLPGVTLSKRYWDFGDSTFDSTSSVTLYHTYNKVGSYYLKLVVRDNVGCMDSLAKLSYIHVQKPVAQFFATPVNSCPGSPIAFVNTSLGIPLKSYWDFGDGDTSQTYSPTHSYKVTGTYTIRLIVVDTLGCRDTLTKINYVRIFTKPHAAFTLDDTFSICSPLVVNFTNHSTGAISYTWYFGDPTSVPSYLLSPSWTYVDPGVYTVFLVATNAGGCSDTAQAVVRLLGYKGAFDYSPLRGCAPLTVNFETKLSDIPHFIFDFDDGTTLKTTSKTATHTYTAPGPKIPKLIMTDDSGCSAESIGLDTIFIDGVYHGFYVTPYPTCDSGNIQFVDTSRGAYSAIIKREWIFHDGATSNIFNPFHNYHGPGKYPVILIDSTTSGCVDSFNSFVIFYNLPNIVTASDTTICNSDSATLSATGGVVYTWSPASGLSCSTCFYPKASPTVKTEYTVIGTDIHGCKNTDSITVDIKYKTTSTAVGSGEICEGEYLQLGDSAGPYSVYTWVPPYGLNDPKSNNPIANPDTTVHYMAIAKQAGCIADTQYVNVIVHPRPVIDLGPDQKMIAGDQVQLNAIGTNIYRILWRPTESLSCDSCLNPIARPKDAKTIYVASAYSDFGCRDSAKVTVFVVCDQSQVFMPNTFTPNGDGQNDIFYPRGKGLRIIKSFRIFNRWGQLMFEKHDFNTNEKQNGWDGTFKGAPLSSDVFVYTLEAICDTGEPMAWKGDIALIR